MEVTVKKEKMNTMTNTWRKTKTKQTMTRMSENKESKHLKGQL